MPRVFRSVLFIVRYLWTASPRLLPVTECARRSTPEGRVNTIIGIIKYPPLKKRKKSGLKARRAAWAEDGRCTQCGGERPCTGHQNRKRKT